MFSAILLSGASNVWAQDAARLQEERYSVETRDLVSVVVRPSARGAAADHAPIGVGDVGAELLDEHALRTSGRASALQNESLQNEVTTAELKRGAFIGGGIGLVAGAAVGALLGGDRNGRFETAFPGALAGLAVGTPVGVYVRTGRSSRYLWGSAGVVGVVAAGTALLIAE